MPGKVETVTKTLACNYFPRRRRRRSPGGQEGPQGYGLWDGGAIIGVGVLGLFYGFHVMT
jgi:hypothetical protein